MMIIGRRKLQERQNLINNKVVYFFYYITQDHFAGYSPVL